MSFNQQPNPEWYTPRFVTEEHVYSLRERFSLWWVNLKSAILYFPRSCPIWVEVFEGDPRYGTAIIFQPDPNPLRYEFTNGTVKLVKPDAA
jgi:hypothetical protein